MNHLKGEIASIMLVALFSSCLNVCLMHFFKFDPFYITLGSVLGLVFAAAWRKING